MLHKLNSLKTLFWMQVLEGRKRIFIRHWTLLFQYQGTTALQFCFTTVLKLKFERTKNPKPREKIPTIASSSKRFTDSNQLFCCCGKETSFTEFLKIFKLLLLGKKSCIWKSFLKCLHSLPCKSGRWVALDLERVDEFSDLTGQSIFLRSRGTRCTHGRTQGRGARRGSQAGAKSSSPGSLMPHCGMPHKAVSAQALGKLMTLKPGFLPPLPLLSGLDHPRVAQMSWGPGTQEQVKLLVSCSRAMLMPLLVPSKTAPWVQNGKETLIKSKAVRTKDPADFTGCRRQRAKTE